jgi:hypothetical protein
MDVSRAEQWAKNTQAAQMAQAFLKLSAAAAPPQAVYLPRITL